MIKQGLDGFCSDIRTSLATTSQFISVLAFTAMTSFASINNCPVTTGSLSRTFTGGPTYSGVVVPGSTTGTPLANSLSALGTVGCTAIDLNFSNFAVSTTGTNENALASLAGTYLSVTPTGTTQTGPDTLLFATLQGDGTGADNAQNDGVDNYKVNNSETFTTTQSYAVTDSASRGIFEVLLTVNDITIATGGSGSFGIDTCLKGTGTNNPTGNITSQAACNKAVGGTGVFQTSTITLAQLASQTASISFASHPTYVNVTQVITLTGGTGINETGFLTFSDQFEESPEPSTFVLMGTALAAVVFTRFRASFGADKRT
jgi:hypothetical protein